MKSNITNGISSVLLLLAGMHCYRTGHEKLDIGITFTGEYSADQTPVYIDIPEEIKPARVWEARGVSPASTEVLFAQRVHNPRDEKESIVLLLNREEGNLSKNIRFSLAPAERIPEPAFTFQDDGKTTMSLSEEWRPVFKYNYGMMFAEGVPEDRRRSSYLHPVYGLDGKILTDDFPKDHYHHRGVFWAWPHVTMNGDSSSLWDIRGVHHRFEKWLGQETGPVFARFGVSNGWYMDEKKIMQEDVWVTVFRAGRAGRIMDFHFTFTPTRAAVSLLGAENKGYGGFNCRFAPFTDPVITTDEGIQEKDSDRLRFPWADLSAKFSSGDTYSGIAIFDHPTNPGTPNTWTLRHYGFLNPSWPSLETYTVEPGKPLTQNYRVLIHRGDAAEGKVNEAYSIYINSPEIQIATGSK